MATALLCGLIATVAFVHQNGVVDKRNAATARKNSIQESDKKESINQQKFKNTREDVDYLFSNSNHTKLSDGITTKEVSDTWDEVDKLPSSDEKTQLHSLVKQAMKLADAELEKYDTSSYSQSNSSSSPSHKAQSHNSKYKKVSLSTFTALPDKYDGKFIQTSGDVIYIQRNPHDATMDYVVIVPKGDTNASEGTVTEMDREYVKNQHIVEGSNITVKGSGLTQTVEFNGKTLETDIIVDSVVVN